MQALKQKRDSFFTPQFIGSTWHTADMFVFLTEAARYVLTDKKYLNSFPLNYSAQRTISVVCLLNVWYLFSVPSLSQKE